MLTEFYPNMNTLAIHSDAISPDTKGMTWKQQCKVLSDAFKLSYEERIERFASEAAKKEIRAAIAAHPGCKITEFIPA